MFTEDLDEFLDPIDFAIEVETSKKTFYAIFDAEPYDVELGEGIVSINAPRLTACKASDVSDLSQGDVITVDGSDYTVKDVRPDGTGLATVELKE